MSIEFSFKFVFLIIDEVWYVFVVMKCGVDELLIEEEFVQKFVCSVVMGMLLCIKFGFDLIVLDIYIGYMVVLNKMCQLQDFGYMVIFLIGDFMLLIGDLLGCNVMCLLFMCEQIELNVKIYFEQVVFVFDCDKIEICYNSEWLMLFGVDGMIKFVLCYMVVWIFECEDFMKCFQGGVLILIYEFLYLLMQGYDLVVLNVDFEFGGIDQKFNLLVGCELQKQYGQEQQCILMMLLFEGFDGVEKMFKLKGNYVGISEKLIDMFGKLMSILDMLMWCYFELLLFCSFDEIVGFKCEVEGGCNLCDFKVLFVQEIVVWFYLQFDVECVFEDFNYCVKGGVLDDILLVMLVGVLLVIGQLLKQVGFVLLISEVLCNIEQGGVKIDGVIVLDKGLKVEVGEFVVQVGKCCFVCVMLIV